MVGAVGFFSTDMEVTVGSSSTDMEVTLGSGPGKV